MTHDATAHFGYITPYWRFVREERHFCAILAHLLMQSGDNVQRFVRLVNSQLETEGLPSLGDLAANVGRDAEIYLEFAFLRDRWNQFDLDRRASRAARNANKREFLLTLFARVENLSALHASQFPEDVAAFNARFVGPSGLRITQDIASPALWPVPALLSLANELAADDHTRKYMFRDLCRFKWAFRIKPDLVLVAPGIPPLCIEAKLMSGEGRYPVSAGECGLFDDLFQPPEHRVRQIELQDFMFSVLLGTAAQQLFVSQGHGALSAPAVGRRTAKVPGLSWRQVFDCLDWSASLPSVAAFLDGNMHIQDVPLVEPGRGPTTTGQYFDGTASGLDALLALLTDRRQQQRSTEIGYTGGARKLREETLDSLVSRKWKWRDPDTNAGDRKPVNWIEAGEFERIIEELRQAALAGD